MSAVATPPRAEPGPGAGPGLYRKRSARTRLLEGRESAAIFGLAFAAYGALGLRLVVQQHLVVFDALARLSHAYFVWFNDPPKLAAVGFVWPPIGTLVFLPLAALKPLATSLAALPLTSAAFAAGLLVLLNRILAVGGLRPLLRYPLLLAFALNPMIVFYATNGMSEVVYLFFLVAAVYFFLRWYLTRQAAPLVLASVAFAIGILTRYEVITWAVLLTVVVAAVLMRQRVSRDELEGSLLTYLAPIFYGLGLWLFFNWLILGNPFHWLLQQAPGASNLAGGEPAEPAAHLGAGEIGLRLVELNWNLFPLTLVVLSVLVAVVAVRRDPMALALTLLLALNAGFTALIVYVSQAESYLQLRYNMRAMPLALVGVAWLYLIAGGRTRRRAIWATTLALLVLAIPLSWRTMQTYPIQYLEHAFTRAVTTWEDQEGTTSRGGYGVGIAAQRRVADEVLRRTSRGDRDRILTDDGQTFSVMLLTGRPGLFLDRIDQGDDEWYRVLERPWGEVSYLLLTNGRDDRIRLRYPRLADTGVPGFELAYEDQGIMLFRVAPRAPAPPG